MGLWYGWTRTWGIYCRLEIVSFFILRATIILIIWSYVVSTQLTFFPFHSTSTTSSDTPLSAFDVHVHTQQASSPYENFLDLITAPFPFGLKSYLGISLNDTDLSERYTRARHIIYLIYYIYFYIPHIPYIPHVPYILHIPYTSYKSPWHRCVRMVRTERAEKHSFQLFTHIFTLSYPYNTYSHSHTLITALIPTHSTRMLDSWMRDICYHYRYFPPSAKELVRNFLNFDMTEPIDILVQDQVLLWRECRV